MIDEEKDYQKCLQEFYNIYAELLKDKAWQSTPMFKLYHAKLVQLREELAELAHISASNKPQEQVPTSEDRANYFKSLNMQLIYIYLYTSDGKSMEAWARLVSNVHKQYVSRPIYDDEFDAQSTAQATPVLLNAGYVAVWVDKAAIMPQSEEHPLKDKMGRHLISLKDRAIDFKNIEYFWNNYVKYTWRNGKLEFSEIAEKIIK